MSETEVGISFAQAWGYGGMLMWVLAGFSVIALALIVYLFIVQRRESVAPSTLVSDILKAITSKDIGEARRLAESRPCPYSVLALAALDGAKSGSREALKEELATEGSHISGRLHASVDYLADIGAIAPLVGLLGTVLGMFSAFGGIAQGVVANAKPIVLAQGVSQAIVTTIFGLVVAIPSLIAYAFLRRRASRRVAELESRAVELENVTL